jgi:MOSC domain-containing protein YiiM
MLELEAGLPEVSRSPRDEGALELIVARPRPDERTVLEDGELNLRDGLVGDSWGSRTSHGSPHPDTQLTLMNARVIQLLAETRSRWPLAGDQLFVDLDLSVANVPPWTQLSLGTAVIELTDEPHTGCGKFVERFGLDAMKFVNSERGRRLGLRGVNAKVVQPGRIRVGEPIRKR